MIFYVFTIKKINIIMGHILIGYGVTVGFLVVVNILL